MVGDDPQSWSAAGFAVDGDVCRVGTVDLRLVGTHRGRGLMGWTLAGVDGATTSVDGVTTSVADGDAAKTAAKADVQPNGVIEIDHVVLATPNVDRTMAAINRLGWEPRRERQGRLGDAPVRQVFYRPNRVIVEVVGPPEVSDDGPASLWGVTFTVADIDAAAAHFGPAASPVREAVQPGRKILTLRHRALNLSVRTAVISPEVRQGG